MNLSASECFRAPEDFSDIEGGLEVIQNQDTGMAPGPGQFVPVPVPAEPPLGRSPFRLHHQSYFMGSGHELSPDASFLDPGMRNRYNDWLNEQEIKCK
jgi:hypothetical protein